MNSKPALLAMLSIFPDMLNETVNVFTSTFSYIRTLPANLWHSLSWISKQFYFSFLAGVERAMINSITLQVKWFTVDKENLIANPSKIFRKESRDRDSLAWAENSLSVYKYFGLLFVTPHHSVVHKFHEHSQKKYVGVRILWKTFWFYTHARCFNSAGSRLDLASIPQTYKVSESIRKHPLGFWHQYYNRYFESVRLIKKGSAEQSFSTWPVFLGTFMSQGKSRNDVRKVANMSALIKNVDGSGLSYEDLHVIYYHPEDFDYSLLNGIPGEYFMKVAGLPGSFNLADKDVAYFRPEDAIV